VAPKLHNSIARRQSLSREKNTNRFLVVLLGTPLYATFCLGLRVSAWSPERTKFNKLHHVIDLRKLKAPVAPKLHNSSARRQ
jgi:hypothetical protein